MTAELEEQIIELKKLPRYIITAGWYVSLFLIIPTTLKYWYGTIYGIFGDLCIFLNFVGLSYLYFYVYKKKKEES